jgi:uncharacterized protein YggL (DUF469 family)
MSRVKQTRHPKKKKKKKKLPIINFRSLLELINIELEEKIAIEQALVNS